MTYSKYIFKKQLGRYKTLLFVNDMYTTYCGVCLHLYVLSCVCVCLYVCMCVSVSLSKFWRLLPIVTSYTLCPLDRYCLYELFFLIEWFVYLVTYFFLLSELNSSSYLLRGGSITLLPRFASTWNLAVLASPPHLACHCFWCMSIIFGLLYNVCRISFCLAIFPSWDCFTNICMNRSIFFKKLPLILQLS